MKEEHLELIVKCRKQLIQTIVRSRCLDDLIDHLATRDLDGNYGLTPSNIIDIRGGHHTDEATKVRTFLEILTTRGENAYDRFINAIKDSHQTGLIEILNSELPPDQQIGIERSTSAASASAPASSPPNVTIGGNDGGQGGVHGNYQAGGNNSGNTHSDNHSTTNSGAGAGQQYHQNNSGNLGNQIAGGTFSGATFNQPIHHDAHNDNRVHAPNYQGFQNIGANSGIQVAPQHGVTQLTHQALRDMHIHYGGHAGQPVQTENTTSQVTTSLQRPRGKNCSTATKPDNRLRGLAFFFPLLYSSSALIYFVCYPTKAASRLLDFSSITKAIVNDGKDPFEDNFPHLKKHQSLMTWTVFVNACEALVTAVALVIFIRKCTREKYSDKCWNVLIVIISVVIPMILVIMHVPLMIAVFGNSITREIQILFEHGAVLNKNGFGQLQNDFSCCGIDLITGHSKTNLVDCNEPMPPTCTKVMSSLIVDGLPIIAFSVALPLIIIFSLIAVIRRKPSNESDQKSEEGLLNKSRHNDNFATSRL
uniref:CARD domain-containing protein n=1 Tax=Plectus sambesii TaxID=2011161 RepID=A0A914X9A6_9BILA